MKILMVNKFLYPKGGAETYMIDLGSYLSSLSHTVEYFGMDCEERTVSNSTGEYKSEIDYNNASIIKKLTSPLETVYSKEAKKKLGIVLDSFKPDIVHMNNINFQLTPSVYYAAKERNIPIVQTVHDVQIACPNHRFYIEHREEVCTQCKDRSYVHCIKNKCVHASTLQSAVAAIESYYYHKRNTYNLVDRYICPSQFMADAICEAGVEESRVTVLHNYSPDINRDKVVCDKLKDKYILYFGRISIEKGLKLLFDVVEKSEGVKLIVAGSGPLEEELKARKLKNVEFVGFKSGAELHRLISDACCSVYPSQWYENCPMSVIESISLGTPVVTCDIGGTMELIENGKNGIIYKAESKAALKDALETIYFNDDLIKEMSDYCIKHGSTDSLAKYAQKLLNIYGELI